MTMRWSSAWTVERNGDGLVLSAGADLRVAVDGLDKLTELVALDWQAGGAVQPRSDAEHQLVDRLVEVDALAVDVSPPVTMVGDVLLDLGSPAGRLEESPHGLVVVVRTGAAWPTVPDRTVHLGLDLSLHHTIVL